MALQIRRGLQADLPASPADGELLYATDTNKLYVGDNGTAQEISGGAGGGLTNVIEDTSPQLGGNLDTNGFSIISAENVDINIDPGIGGKLVLKNVVSLDGQGNFTSPRNLNISPTGVLSIGNNTNSVDGNVYITRNSYGTGLQDGFTFAQHHESADAVNFQFLRTRGTGSATAPVLNGDDIVDIWFLGRANAGQALAAAMSVIVEGAPNTNHVPAKISFATNNGTATAIRAELSSTGVWKTNSIQNLSGTSLSLTATTVSVTGNMQLNAQSDLRFADSDSSNWVAFQAPATVTSNVTWTLPATDGTTGQILSTNGAGVLSWTANGGGSGLSARATLAPVSTASIANGASENLMITGYKGYILYRIQTTAAAWVRLYSSTAARDADAGRLEGTDPLPGAGVIAEVITTGNETVLITPGAIGFSTELTPDTNIPCTVTNKSGITTTITVTVTALQIEV